MSRLAHRGPYGRCGSRRRRSAIRDGDDDARAPQDRLGRGGAVRVRLGRPRLNRDPGRFASDI